jgi:hypothetical protein
MNLRKLTVVALVVLAGTTARTALAAKLTVSTTMDELLTDGQCSLREAITNINDGGSTFPDCVPEGDYGIGDRIYVPAGTYTIASAAYNIATDVSIVGAGAATTVIDGAWLDRVFVIGNYSVFLSDLTITRGQAAWPGGWSGGGAIYNNGTLTIANSAVTNSAVHGDRTCGGGIYNAGTLVISNSTISGNWASGWWGCGAGGIYNAGMLTLANCTISGNVADGRLNHGGAGILNNGTLDVTNSTITQNRLGEYGTGGGILNWGLATITNSIVANQVSGADCDGVITSGGYNLEGSTSCSFSATGDMQNANPLLGPLQDNGGPTPTHALLDASPALDAIPYGVNGCGTTVTTDQRGVTRPQPSNGPCDIGALELEKCLDPPSGMVSWWRAENSADDGFGTNHGTLWNGATFAPGRVGQAFSLDGVDDYVEVPNVVDGWPQGTVMAWVRFDDPTPGPNGTYIFCASVNPPLGGDSDGTNLGVHPFYGNDIRFGTYTSNWQWAASGVVPVPGRWYHLAATWGNEGMRIYLDGVLAGTNPHVGPSYDSNFNTIGASSWAETAFHGLIDEVAVFDRELNAEEIAAAYNAGIAGFCFVERHTLVVTRSGTGSGVVTSSPSGIACEPDCTERYAHGTIVTLTATAHAGSSFVGWSGDEDCLDGVVTMDGDKNCVATFVLNTYGLTVSVTGTGSGTVRSDPAGIECGSDCFGTYDYNTTVTLTATAHAGSSFVGWSGDEDCLDGVVTMDGDKNCVATFVLNTYGLTVSVTGTGSGTVRSDPAGIECGSDCFGTYDYNTTVTLTATAHAGSSFVGWSGDEDCLDGVVTMDGDKNCVATFVLNTYGLTVSVTGTGSGTVRSDPAGIECGSDCFGTYDYNTTVTLTATAHAGSSFVGWSGDEDCLDGVVTMDGDKNCVATFRQDDQRSTASGGCGCQASPDGSGEDSFTGSFGVFLLLIAGLCFSRKRRSVA